MAQRVHVILEDDYDGTTAEETVAFGLDGTEYEIDLSRSNADALREALAPWMTNARKVTAKRRRGGRSVEVATTGQIRAWAQANGHPVSGRGRVARGIREAYEKAHA
jgi:hypothetical protein